MDNLVQNLDATILHSSAIKSVPRLMREQVQVFQIANIVGHAPPELFLFDVSFIGGHGELAGPHFGGVSANPALATVSCAASLDVIRLVDSASGRIWPMSSGSYDVSGRVVPHSHQSAAK